VTLGAAEQVELLREIAGHLNRVVQQNERIIGLLMLQNGLRSLNADERKWLSDCRKEASKAA
jgi:hypothetical protein